MVKWLANVVILDAIVYFIKAMTIMGTATTVVMKTIFTSIIVVKIRDAMTLLVLDAVVMIMTTIGTKMYKMTTMGLLIPQMLIK